MSRASPHTIISEIPREIWDNITNRLPSFNSWIGTSARKLKLENKDIHDLIWNSMFKTDKFFNELRARGLSAAVVGFDLRANYSKKQKPSQKKNLKDIPKWRMPDKKRPEYLALVLYPYVRNMERHIDRREQLTKLLLESLQPHQFDDFNYTIRFSSNNIILCISELMATVGDENLADAAKLLGGRRKHSYYLYWQDPKYSLRCIEAKDILMIKPTRDLPASYATIRLSWTDRPSKEKVQRVFRTSLGGYGPEIQYQTIDGESTTYLPIHLKDIKSIKWTKYMVNTKEYGIIHIKELEAIEKFGRKLTLLSAKPTSKRSKKPTELKKHNS